MAFVRRFNQKKSAEDDLKKADALAYALLARKLKENLSLTRQVEVYLSAQMLADGVSSEITKGDVSAEQARSGSNVAGDSPEPEGVKSIPDNSRILSQLIEEKGKNSKFLFQRSRHHLNRLVPDKRSLTSPHKREAARPQAGDLRKPAPLVASAQREDDTLHIYCAHASGAQRVRLEVAGLQDLTGCSEVRVHVRPGVMRSPRPRPVIDAPVPPMGVGADLRGLAGRLNHPALSRAVLALANTVELKSGRYI